MAAALASSQHPKGLQALTHPSVAPMGRAQAPQVLMQDFWTRWDQQVLKAAVEAWWQGSCCPTVIQALLTLLSMLLADALGQLLEGPTGATGFCTLDAGYRAYGGLIAQRPSGTCGVMGRLCALVLGQQLPLRYRLRRAPREPPRALGTWTPFAGPLLPLFCLTEGTVCSFLFLKI